MGLSEIALKTLATGVCAYICVHYLEKLMNSLDPTIKENKRSKTKAKILLEKLGKAQSDLNLNEHEMTIASQLLVPEDIPVSWKDVGGLESVVNILNEAVILPFQRGDLFKKSKLFASPKGVLLYGPPGCGKTMLAKATAKEANCTFINVELSQLTNKWYGESVKLAAAVFSLAIKLKPCIIFIDEIDAFFQTRSDRDNEATALMKATFMSLWDGLVSCQTNEIVVMGATNRPQSIDQAFLRRMPVRVHVEMPNSMQRKSILSLILSVETLSTDVDLKKLANCLIGFSGSDINELCRHASVARVHQHIKEEIETDLLRSISMADLVKAANFMKKSKNIELFGAPQVMIADEQD